MKIAFIGLGIMGSRMAANLVKNGEDVKVYNRSRGPVKILEDLGATGCDTFGEALQDAEVTFTMLSTPEVLEYVMMEEGGGLDMMKRDSLWVDCTTVNPSFSERSREASAQHGIRFVDAPVAGTKPHAQNADLVFFVGGEKSDVQAIEPLLNHMGKKVLHLGASTRGTAFKMLVNIMLGQSMIIFSEAVILGEKMGFDRDMLLNSLSNLVVSAPFTKIKSEMIKADNYEVQFPLEWMHKDLHLASITAYEQGQPLYLANMAKELFAEANKNGMGRLDFAAIHKYLEGKK